MEQQHDSMNLLGVVICKYCFEEQAIIDTEGGVRIFYVDCLQNECISHRESGEELVEI